MTILGFLNRYLFSFFRPETSPIALKYLPDMDLEELPGSFDGSICLWRQDFDYFHSKSWIGKLIRELKNDDSEIAKNVFAEAILDFLQNNPLERSPDIVTIVPDSSQRSFQTVASIASRFCGHMNWPFVESLIEPVKISKPQKNRSWSEREHDTAARYRLSDPEMVSGKHVLIFDDIFATGQSLIEAAELMHDAGAEYVSVLSLVQLVHDE